MNKSEHLLTDDDVMELIHGGQEPNFLSLAKLIKLAAEKGFMAYYYRNKEGSVQDFNALYNRCANKHHLTAEQLQELNKFMSDGHMPFQLAARMAYNNCKI